jgi:hypothetical protein
VWDLWWSILSLEKRRHERSKPNSKKKDEEEFDVGARKEISCRKTDLPDEMVEEKDRE